MLLASLLLILALLRTGIRRFWEPVGQRSSALVLALFGSAATVDFALVLLRGRLLERE